MYGELQQLEFKHGEIKYHESARIVEVTRRGNPVAPTTNEETHLQRVVVATAGTTGSYVRDLLQFGSYPSLTRDADINVAEEAAVTLECTGLCKVDRVYDVGVAGLHRILGALPVLSKANCVIVAAGMDGALPSVVGGLVKAPTIAVPTSIGYGAAFGGISPLLTMLNSCSPGECWRIYF